MSKEDINLPKTSFSMKANLPIKEPEILKIWEKMNLFKKLIKNKTVYLTFDVDVFDSSVMAATGTPEPGGLFWDETIKIIKIAAKNSRIVGADINELAPIKGFDIYNFLAAKLVYKILAYRFIKN